MSYDITSRYDSTKVVYHSDTATTVREAVSEARARGANLYSADLYSADLHGADLSDANLHGADLSGADLRSARHAWHIPIIADIHRRMLSAVTAEGCRLDMQTWHTCETTHCRAGWAVTLAGEAGKVLESIYGTGTAAALIYQASDPTMERVPDWYASDDEAMQDMERLAAVGSEEKTQ